MSKRAVSVDARRFSTLVAPVPSPIARPPSLHATLAGNGPQALPLPSPLAIPPELRATLAGNNAQAAVNFQRVATVGSTESTDSRYHVASRVRASIQSFYQTLKEDLKDRQAGTANGEVFQEVRGLKRQRSALTLKQNRIHNNSIFGKIAQHKMFDNITTSVICLNAVWMGYDIDYAARWGKADDLYSGPPIFLVAELSFCIYFSLELLIRFCAYLRLRYVLTDGWFVFDSLLVALMLIETVVLPFAVHGNSGAGKLSILRLLRLLRVTRMARVIRQFPELGIIVKGLAAAFRSTSWVSILLVLQLFTFSILFASIYHQGKRTDDEVVGTVEAAFGSTGKSMFTLFFKGTLLDDVSNPCNLIRQDSRSYMLIAFLVCIILTSFMMLQMLTGILVQVVASTAQGQKKALRDILLRKSILSLCEEVALASEPFGSFTRGEFLMLEANETMMDHIKQLGIYPHHLPALASVMFAEDDDGTLVEKLHPEDVMEYFFAMDTERPLNSGQFLDIETSINAQRKKFARRLAKVWEQLGHKNIRRADSVFGDDIDSYPLVDRVKGERTETCLSVCSEGKDLPVQSSTERRNSWMKKRTSDSDQTMMVTPPVDLNPPCLSLRDSQNPLISKKMLLRLQRVKTSLLVDEIRRRLACEDLQESGVPLDWFDDETREKLEPLVQNE